MKPDLSLKYEYKLASSKNEKARVQAEEQLGHNPLGRRKPGQFGNLLCVEMGDRDPEMIMTKEAKTRPCKALYTWKNCLGFYLEALGTFEENGLY